MMYEESSGIEFPIAVMLVIWVGAGVPELANKNTGHPLKFKFQINNN